MSWSVEIQGWLNTVGVLGGPALIIWQLIRSNAVVVAAATNAEVAATKAETAAFDAAGHVKVATETVSTMATNIAELTVNTNSIKDALVATTGELGRMTGREEMRAEQDRKPET